jgi:MSHA biogenesis protein MshI
MNRLFQWRRGAREPGWLAVSLQAGALNFAHGVSESGKKSAIRSWGTRTVDDSPKDFERVTKELGAERYQCLSLLPSNDYQLLLVDAPNVPAPELKAAVRWKLKDMLDYPADDATIDVLDIPVPAAAAARGHSMYAVAARNEVIQATIERFTAAEVPLSVIDIGETAQRNIAALFETQERALGMLYLYPRQALLTINFRGELYLARRIDAGTEQLLDAPPAQHDDALNRILLELQRSMDHLDRQFPFLTLAKLLLAPEPRETGLAAHLSANLGLPVERAQLQTVIEFGDATPDDETAWRLFHVLGAALRNETKTP